MFRDMVLMREAIRHQSDPYYLLPPLPDGIELREGGDYHCNLCGGAFVGTSLAEVRQHKAQRSHEIVVTAA